MRLKFHLLPAGQPFTWRGKHLVKNGPVTATDTEGKQQMVPKSALVVPEAEPDSDEPEPATRAGQRVADAKIALQSGLDERIEALSDRLTPSELNAAKTDLGELVDRFFNDAGLDESTD